MTEPIRHQIQGLPHQMAFWANQRDLSHLAIVGALGTGKTYSLAMKALQLAKINGAVPGMLVVPTYQMGTLIHVEEWPKIMARYGVKLEWKRKRFEWPWGAITWMLSAEKPERLVGGNLAYTLWDEPGQISRDAWDKGSVRARDPNAKCRQNCLAGTPEGLNWYADLFDDPEAEPDEDGWTRTTIRAKTWHPDMAHYPKQLRQTYSYDPTLLDAYGRGLFVPMRQGRAFRQFNRDDHVGVTEYDPALPLILGCDFNVDHMVWQVLQVGKDWIQFHDEIALPPNSSTEDAADLFASRWRSRHPGEVVVCGDAAGAARSTSGSTDYDIIREVLSEANFTHVRFDVPKSNPRVKARVDSMNYHLSGRGKTVTISSACRRLIRDFERVQWRKGATTPDLEKSSDETLTHASDGGTYAVWRRCPIRIVRRSKVVTEMRRKNDPILHGAT